MLEVYKDEYKEFYSIFNNAIVEDKISHAYMFEIDDNLDVDQFIKRICKALLIRKESDNYLSELIDNETYPNIKRIRNDGLWIKKEQILDIQEDFRKESFDNKLKIYIIEDASKLNKESANTLLKFLEEPESGIIALLLTKNKYSVIKTIVSRCINITLKKKKYEEIQKDDISYRIVDIIEKYKEKALPYLYNLILEDNYDRMKLMSILENVEKIYSDLLHFNNGIDDRYNYYEHNDLADINFEKNNSLLMKKVDAICRNMEYLKYNVNIKTVLDKIVIDVYGGD